MRTEIVFLIGAGTFAVLTVFLGISNWIFLASLSAKISGLEDEIEKKTSELESLKKEKQAVVGTAGKDIAQPAEKSSYADAGSSQQIEIVRNVPGGGFENYNAAQHAPEPRQSLDQGREAQSDILDVVDEAPALRSESIMISLFSNAKKDTDFTAAWQRLMDILPKHPNPRIAIDFSNVMFLYEREIQYLEKFRDVILQAGGSISFVNCESETAATLSNHGGLAPYVSA